MREEMENQVADMMRHTARIPNYSQRKREIEKGVKTILKALGCDLSDEHLVDTPTRVARMLLTETCIGYFSDPSKILSVEFSEKQYDQMIFVSGIDVESVCSHHGVPFRGKAYVAYLPAKKITGLSKLSRLVDVYARRLQVQERLTEEVAMALYETLQPRGCGVYIRAQHLCGAARGVRNRDMLMETISLKGEFLNNGLKNEFLMLCNSHDGV